MQKKKQKIFVELRIKKRNWKENGQRITKFNNFQFKFAVKEHSGIFTDKKNAFNTKTGKMKHLAKNASTELNFLFSF